jgi:uncharacterized protein (DUF302 family)
MNRLIFLLVFSFTLLTPFSLVAEDNVMMARTNEEFKVALDEIMAEIEEQGYTVAHVQRCDGGMVKMGYETDKYRVVFFGKADEVRELSREHEALIPYLPFKAVVYSEGDDTILSILHPKHMQSIVKDNPAFDKKVEQWEKDFSEILAEASV